MWIHGQGTASTLIFIVKDLTSPALSGCRIFLTFGDYLSDPTKREAQTCGQLSVNSPQTSSDIYHLMPENAARVLQASSAPTAPRSLRPSPLSAFGFCWAPGFVSPPFAFRGHMHAVPGALTCPCPLPTTSQPQDAPLRLLPPRVSTALGAAAVALGGSVSPGFGGARQLHGGDRGATGLGWDGQGHREQDPGVAAAGEDSPLPWLVEQLGPLFGAVPGGRPGSGP